MLRQHGFGDPESPQIDSWPRTDLGLKDRGAELGVASNFWSRLDHFLPAIVRLDYLSLFATDRGTDRGFGV